MDWSRAVRQSHLNYQGQSDLYSAVSPTPTMCYRVYTHAMRCDVRPVLSDGENQLLDPYASPNHCRCPSDRRTRHPCRDHGCCSLSVRMYECPARCRSAIIYHLYTQRQSSKGVHFRPDELERRWRDLPCFDGAIFPIADGARACAAESVEFRLARDQILEVGRVLDQTLLEIDDAQADARTLARWHDREHGSRCARRQQSACSGMERVLNAKEHFEDLALALEGYRQLWRRWKVFLRGLERRGERRLGGLEEWRRRRGGGGEKEEHERLTGLYRREIRADEVEMKARRREREEEVAAASAGEDSGFESQGEYSGDEREQQSPRRRRRASMRDDRCFLEELRPRWSWFR
ncbi:hypothetical protein F5X68DRAFT_199843 [Plectosphaerella plurivora]|uniref:Uncharacterized protein n=1 Tax=Plectosphaerella plurivora TaxID=936078 RepID=A0A9P8VI40_9PEZI|nr:hypothetical protein F5X68DRAFT_199843 [Plectosphaerella plurivora]